MFCNNCGKEIPENSGFCPECGTPVANAEQAGTNNNAVTDNAAVENNASVSEVISEVNKKSKAPLIIILVLLIIAGTGAFGAKAYIDKKTAAEEAAYKEMMTAFGNDLKAGIYNNVIFVGDIGDTYRKWSNLFEQLGADDAYSNSKYGYLLFHGGNGYDNSEFLNKYNDKVADLNSEATLLKDNLANLSEPPKRYESVYGEINLIYDEFAEYHEFAVNKATFTSNSYNNLHSDFTDKTNSLVPKMETIDELLASMEDQQAIENLSTAKSIYNAVNTTVVDNKAQTGNYPTAEQLAERLNSAEEPLFEVPKGVTAAVSYSESTGSVNSVWVCSSKKGITGTDKDKYLVCYDPQVDGNAANSENFSYDIVCINGGNWQYKQ